jgi:pimeloyl-ACP methyl ester carboxylesterase
MTEPRRFTLSLTDGDMAGLDFGDPGAPIGVVFLHATGFNASTYRQSLALAGQSLRVVALDQRGHGLSRLLFDPENLEDWRPFAKDLVDAIDLLNPSQPVVLSGHSMGGAVAVTAAERLGDRVRGLVLIDPVMMRVRGVDFSESPLVIGARRRRPDFDSKAAVLEAYLGRGAFKTWPAEAVADYVEDGFREDGDHVTLTCRPEWEAAIFSVSTKFDPLGPLDRLTVPVSVLRAEHNSTCHLDPAKHIDPWPNRSLTTVEHSSHFLPMERPELIAQAWTHACA